MLLFQAKSHAVLDRAEDPRDILDYGYTQQQELLCKVKQGLVEVSTSKAQLQQQVQKLHLRIPQLEEQARRAVASSKVWMIAVWNRRGARLHCNALTSRARRWNENKTRLWNSQGLSSKLRLWRKKRRNSRARCSNCPRAFKNFARAARSCPRGIRRRKQKSA
jgi:phage shock protein A